MVMPAMFSVLNWLRSCSSSMSIGFKGTFLIEMLSNINAQEIAIELADPARAGVIVPTENEKDEKLLALLMPMMLNN